MRRRGVKGLHMPTNLSKTFSKNLRRILHERNLSAADMSRSLSISKSTISNWMNANRIPRDNTIDQLCAYLHVSRADLLDDSNGLPQTPAKGIKIKVFGRVAAGVPLEMIEDIYGEEEIHPDMLKGGQEYFGLVIHGDSMEPKMSEGDVVIVRKQEDAETGEIVIATVNGDDATCKRLKKYRDGIELIGLNPSFPPMFFSNEEITRLPVCILGKVVELRAKF